MGIATWGGGRADGGEVVRNKEFFMRFWEVILMGEGCAFHSSFSCAIEPNVMTHMRHNLSS